MQCCIIYSCHFSYSLHSLFLESHAMKTHYFPTFDDASAHYLRYVDQQYPNRFQDATSIARIKIVEFKRGFALQRGDYGPYFTAYELGLN